MTYDLKRFRKEKKLSQREIAEKINIDAARISRYEKGSTSPTIDRLLEKKFRKIREFVKSKSYMIPLSDDKVAHLFLPNEMSDQDLFILSQFLNTIKTTK